MSNFFKIFLFIWYLLISIFQTDSFELTQKSNSFLKYPQSFEKNIISWRVEFKTSNENTIIRCNYYLNKCYIDILSLEDSNWKLEVYVDNKLYTSLDYQINYSPSEYDISSLMTIKRLQERSLSCESSATADILTYLENKNITEYDVSSQIQWEYYNKYKEYKDWKVIWWDPNEWFVWFIWKQSNWENARQSWGTWYWVYEKPIKKVFENYWDNVIIDNNENKEDLLKRLLKEVSLWNMVQLWGDWCTTPSEDIWKTKDKKNYCIYWEQIEKRIKTWYTTEWKLIKWLNWEHAFYLFWYEGENLNNISKVIVWDTYTWYQKYSYNEWMRKWNLLENRHLIILKK